MAHLIDKDALVAEIDKRLHQLTDAAFDSMIGRNLIEIRDFLDTLKVKEVDLEKEIEQSFIALDYHLDAYNRVEDYVGENIDMVEYERIAKHFFELGMRVNNPITAADRGTAEEIIVNLKRVEQDYRIDLTREIEWVRNKAQKGEKV